MIIIICTHSKCILKSAAIYNIIIIQHTRVDNIIDIMRKKHAYQTVLID